MQSNTSSSKRSGMRTPPRFQHEAAFYSRPEDHLRMCLAFVEEGLECGEPVMVALIPERSEALSTALGAAADAVQFVDMTELGTQPSADHSRSAAVPHGSRWLWSRPRNRRTGVARSHRSRVRRGGVARGAAQPGLRQRPGLAPDVSLRSDRSPARGAGRGTAYSVCDTSATARLIRSGQFQTFSCTTWASDPEVTGWLDIEQCGAWITFWVTSRVTWLVGSAVRRARC